MRSIHRIVALFVVLFTLYLGVTGTAMQVIDLHTLLSRAPAQDPEMMAIREGMDGPPVFQVIDASDYTAPVLPAALDLKAAMMRTLASAGPAVAEGSLDFIELRMGHDAPVGQVEYGRRLLRVDLDSDSTSVGPAPPPEGAIVPSLRGSFKSIHRMTAIGNWALWINPAVGIGLLVFVATGLTMYWRLLRARLGRRGLFWSAGGQWRTLHRCVALAAALWLIVVAISGELLAIDSLGLALNIQSHSIPQARGPAPTGISPLPAAEIPPMLATTLAAYAATGLHLPIKVVRLRVYGGMPQGVVIAGRDDATQQIVFDAVTGRQAGETGRGYPATGFPFGWQTHQLLKRIHRGDYFGMTGRWLDLLAGLSLIYLSLSGVIMYLDLWKARRRAGRPALIWWP